MKTIDRALDILKYSLYSREDNVLFEIANKINDMYDVKELVNKVKDVECTKDLGQIKVTLTEAKRYIYPDLSLSKHASAQAKQLGIRKYEYYARVFQCYIDQDKDLDMLTLFRVSNTIYNYIRLNNLSNLVKKMQFKNDKIAQLMERIKQRMRITSCEEFCKFYVIFLSVAEMLYGKHYNYAIFKAITRGRPNLCQLFSCIVSSEILTAYMWTGISFSRPSVRQH